MIGNERGMNMNKLYLVFSLAIGVVIGAAVSVQKIRKDTGT